MKLIVTKLESLGQVRVFTETAKRFGLRMESSLPPSEPAVGKYVRVDLNTRGYWTSRTHDGYSWRSFRIAIDEIEEALSAPLPEPCKVAKPPVERYVRETHKGVQYASDGTIDGQPVERWGSRLNALITRRDALNEEIRKRRAVIKKYNTLVKLGKLA